MPRHAAQPRPLVRLVELATLTKAQITALYNSLADFPVSGFSLYSTALRRLDAVLQRREQIVVDHDTGSPDAREVLPNIWTAHRSSLPDPDVPPRSETRWRDEYTITLLVSHNPKREGSASWLRWQLMRTGQTVGEYLDACEAAGYGRRWRGDIIYALEHDWISLSTPEGESIELPPAYTDL